MLSDFDNRTKDWGNCGTMKGAIILSWVRRGIRTRVWRETKNTIALMAIGNRWIGSDKQRVCAAWHWNYGAVVATDNAKVWDILNLSCLQDIQIEITRNDLQNRSGNQGWRYGGSIWCECWLKPWEWSHQNYPLRGRRILLTSPAWRSRKGSKFF